MTIQELKWEKYDPETELRMILWDVANTAQKRYDDICYRMDKGIYATPRDLTAEQLWADLAEVQNAPEWNMFRNFALLAELQARKQIGAI